MCHSNEWMHSLMIPITTIEYITIFEIVKYVIKVCNSLPKFSSIYNIFCKIYNECFWLTHHYKMLLHALDRGKIRTFNNIAIAL